MTTATGGARSLRVRALALHQNYRCRHTGVCCSSDWDIPVEPGTEERLRAALNGGRLRPPEGLCRQLARGVAPFSGELAGPDQYLWPRAGLPHGAQVVLARERGGVCAFLGTDASRRCAIHGQLGQDALPAACRQFPRVALLGPNGVDVNLSHYCPTVAGLLFEELPSADGAPDPRVRVVEAPPAFPATAAYEGLDAREALPPLLRPGVLMSWAAHEAWEAHVVGRLAGGRVPEEVLDGLAATAERVRCWRPEHGDFDLHLAQVLGSSAEGRAAASPPEPDPLAVWSRVAAAVPRSHARPASPAEAVLPAELAGARRLLAEGWPSLFPAIRRWLATKAFASWLPLQGEGLRTAVLGLRAALEVLRAEALRGCAESGCPLDATLLREAVRRSDLLLVHLADPQALARDVSRCESGAGL